VRAACPQQRLKLIIESGELPLPEMVRQASRIGLDAGVDFLKTSTGKTTHGASLDAARLMLECIAMQPHRVGFKASGGIRTVADAAGYIALVREHLGDDAVAPSRLRFGASGLLSDIERVLSGGSAPAAPASAY
jgi:deoxyribose-phosphate aldolase